MRRHIKSLKNILILIAMGVVFVGGVLTTIVTGQQSDARQRALLQVRAETAAGAVTYKDLYGLSGNENDLSLPQYADIKDTMEALKQVRPDTRFVYLMGYHGGDKLFFYADSEDPVSSDYSPPGDVYEDTNENQLAAFYNGISFVEGPLADEYGTWVSAFAPIKDEYGTTVALLGMDVDSSLWYTRVHQDQVLPAVVTAFILVLMMVYLYFTYKNSEVDRMKSEFVSLASHQLNAPLSTINWFADLLLTDTKDVLSPPQRKNVQFILGASTRMVDLVDALLNISRIEAGSFKVKPTPVKFQDVAMSLLEELDHQIKEKHIEVVKMIDPTLPFISVDLNLLRIVFQNLLTNAVKYNSDGGRLTITVGKNPHYKDMVYVEVADTGLGIPKKDQSKIFQKLFRADNARTRVTDGNGLGLYIVKSIIESTGGKVWFSSVENKETKFSFILPLSGMKARKGVRTLS